MTKTQRWERAQSSSFQNKAPAHKRLGAVVNLPGQSIFNLWLGVSFICKQVGHTRD